ADPRGTHPAVDAQLLLPAGDLVPAGEGRAGHRQAQLLLRRQVVVLRQFAAVADAPEVEAVVALVMHRWLDLTVDAGELEGAFLRQADAQLVAGDGVAVVAEGVAGEEVAGVFGVAAAGGPFDVDGVADAEVGEGDDELLV